MTGWVILAVYLVGYLATWRRTVYFVASDFSGGRIDGEALLFGVIFGSFGTMFWPFVFCALLVRGIYAARGEDVVSIITPRSVKRREKIRAQAARIASLERELGIR